MTNQTGQILYNLNLFRYLFGWCNLHESYKYDTCSDHCVSICISLQLQLSTSTGRKKLTYSQTNQTSPASSSQTSCSYGLIYTYTKFKINYCQIITNPKESALSWSTAVAIICTNKSRVLTFQIANLPIVTITNRTMSSTLCLISMSYWLSLRVTTCNCVSGYPSKYLLGLPHLVKQRSWCLQFQVH